VAIPVNVTS
jgi:hypothetical protein